MSKVLYPRPEEPKPRKKTAEIKKRPYTVLYSDPNGDLDPEWRSYNSQLAVRVDSWYRCRFLGFHTAATLYERGDEDLRALS